MTKSVTLNQEQELYVINDNNFCTCLGFDVALNRIIGLANEINTMCSELKPLDFTTLNKERGTIKVYNILQKIELIAHKMHTENGFKFKVNLTKQLIGLEGKRVEVVDIYGDTRRFKVGKSSGFLPCHIELKNSRSSGGSSVSGAPFKSVRVV